MAAQLKKELEKVECDCLQTLPLAAQKKGSCYCHSVRDQGKYCMLKRHHDFDNLWTAGSGACYGRKLFSKASANGKHACCFAYSFVEFQFV